VASNGDRRIERILAGIETVILEDIQRSVRNGKRPNGR
jgi:hypothetical protein